MAIDRASAAEQADIRRAIDLLRGIVRVVEAEVGRNPRFGRELAALLARTAPPATAPQPPPVRSKPPAPDPIEVHPQAPEAAPAPPPVKRNPPALDPFEVYEQGWEAMLRSRLDRLDTEQLADVIYAYALDPSGSTRRKTADQLRDWIVEAVERKIG